jgi:hypothetical protein
VAAGRRPFRVADLTALAGLIDDCGQGLARAKCKVNSAASVRAILP